MERGPFKEFTRYLEYVTQNWPTSHDHIASAPAGMGKYEALPPTLIRSVVEQATLEGKALPDKLLNHNAQHGLSVIARYLGHAAHAAIATGTNLSELGSILHDERSFTPLATIASNPNKLAYRMEVDYGLGVPFRDFDPYVVSRYSITDGAVSLKDLPYTQAVHVRDMVLEGHELYKAECAAHRSDSLRKIYHSMTDICLRDASLIPLTLAK